MEINNTIYGLTIDQTNNKVRVTKDKKWQTDEFKHILDISKALIVSIDANTYISYNKNELDAMASIIRDAKNY